MGCFQELVAPLSLPVLPRALSHTWADTSNKSKPGSFGKVTGRGQMRHFSFAYISNNLTQQKIL